MNFSSVTGKNWLYKKFDSLEAARYAENYSLDEITAKLLAIRKNNIDNIDLFLNPKITGKMPTPEDILNNRRSTLDNFNDGDFPKMGDMMMGGSGFQKTLRYLKKNGGSSKL